MKIKNAREVGIDLLYVLRIQAVVLYRKGMTIRAIAPLVWAHRNTVGEWVRDWKAGGAKALKPASPGRPNGSGRRLAKDQEKAITRAIVDRCPDQLKMSFALWTRTAVQDYIRHSYGVSLPIRTVGGYLKRWGFTPQKPVRRAYERNEQAVRKWLEKEYPIIQRKAKREKTEIHWGDETGLRSDDVNGRGYAPKGCTPVRLSKGTPEKINMISTITNQGKVRFMFYHGKMNADRLTEFFERLIKASDTKVFLILDNLRVHHAYVVKTWLEEHRKQIELFYLPSYSPDLNPDEYLNCDLKALVSSKQDSRAIGQPANNALGAMRSIQEQPHRVRKYFKQRPISYAA